MKSADLRFRLAIAASVLFVGCFPLQRGVRGEEALIDANARIRDLEKRVEVVERAKGAQADVLVRIDRLAQEISQVRGKVEETGRGKVSSSSDALIVQRLDELAEEVRFLEERVRRFEKAVLAEGESEPSKDVQSEQETYEEARRLYLQKKHPEAVAQFEAFQAKYPKSSLIDNALFWAGMSYYSLREWDKAILKFEEVRGSHEKADKAPDAIYFEGLCFQKKGDAKSARALLEGFEKKYPKSEKLPYVQRLLKELQ